MLFIDGFSCWAGRGLRVHLLRPDSQEQHYMATLTFEVTNNEIECEALVARLFIVATIGATVVEARSGSQVVVNQVLGLYATKEEKLKKYLA